MGKDYRLCKTELTEGFGSLGLDIDLSVIEDHFDKFDKNEDGLIDFDDFLDCSKHVSMQGLKRVLTQGRLF